MKGIDANEAFTEALKMEEQAKYERDPRLIAHCRRESQWWLNEAARLERDSRV
jgi:hypothetical protein